MNLTKILKSVRYSLAGVNCIFLITGFIILITGIVVLLQYRYFDEFVTDRFYKLPSFLIATAVIIFCVGALGFYGAISEHFYFIAAYVGLLVTVLIFEIAMCVVGYGLYNDAISEITPIMRNSVQLYMTRTDVAVMWDDLQMDFECCGARGLIDWGNSNIPVSCCHITYGTISPFHCVPALVHRNGCANILGEWLSYNAYVIGVMAVVLICIQTAIIGVASWLAWRSRYEEVELES